MKTIRRSWWHIGDSLHEFWDQELEFIGAFLYCCAGALAFVLLLVAYGTFPR